MTTANIVIRPDIESCLCSAPAQERSIRGSLVFVCCTPLPAIARATHRYSKVRFV